MVHGGPGGGPWTGDQCYVYTHFDMLIFQSLRNTHSINKIQHSEDSQPQITKAGKFSYRLILLSSFRFEQQF